MPSVLAAEAEVERGDAEVLEERRVVGARAERRRCAGLALARGLRSSAVPPSRAMPSGRSARQTVIFFCGSATSRATSLTNRLERVRAAGAEEAPAVAVGVDVDDRLLPQLLGVGLDPLGRAEQPLLLAVPGGVDDRAPRAPARLHQLAEAPAPSSITATMPLTGSWRR